MGTVRRSTTFFQGDALRRRWPFRTLLRPALDVLPLYTPQRAGWVVTGRRALLLIGVILTAFVYGVMSAILPPDLLLGAAIPLAVMALLVIWALPHAKKAPTRALQVAFVAMFACLILWPKYIAITAGGLPAISIRRVTALALFGLLLICVSISTSFRRAIADVLKASPWLSRFILLFLFCQLCASILSIRPGSTLSRWLDTTMTATAAFFCVLWLFSKGRKDLSWFINILWPIVAVLMVIGFFEARSQQILWLKIIPPFLKMDNEVMQELLKPHVRTWYRVVTTYTTPLAYGEFLALAAPFVIFKLLNATTWSQRLRWIAFEIALFYSIVLSTARLAIIGWFLAHFVAGLLWGVRRWRNAKGDMIGISTTMMYPALLCAFAVSVAVVPSLRVRVLGGGQTQFSNEGRKEQFRQAVPVISRRPVFGYGPGQGGISINWRTADGFLTIDLGFVLMAADYGLPAVGAYIAFMALSILSLIRVGLRNVQSAFPAEFAIAVAILVAASTRIVLAQMDNEIMFLVLFGLAMAALYQDKMRRAGGGPAAVAARA